MNVMRRRLLPALAALCGLGLALPTLSQAQIIEIGKIESSAKPGCPASVRPCFAASRMTGFQAKVGTNRGLMTIPKDGRIVAWTLGLGKPTSKEITFFNDKLGGAAQAQLTVLNPRGKLRYRAVRQGEPVKLQPYFGQTAQFPLVRSIPVKKGWVVGLTVPTWAPILATGLGGDTSWRASRGKGTCQDTQTQTSQLRPNQLAQYYCLYRTARLTYSATLITTPTPNRTSSRSRR
jgi:hypothetical protein